MSKSKFPDIDGKKAEEWAASEEGQKSLIEAIENAQGTANKLKQQRGCHCQCCFCKHQRGIG